VTVETEGLIASDLGAERLDDVPAPAVGARGVGLLALLVWAHGLWMMSWGGRLVHQGPWRPTRARPGTPKSWRSSSPP